MHKKHAFLLQEFINPIISCVYPKNFVWEPNGLKVHLELWTHLVVIVISVSNDINASVCLWYLYNIVYLEH